MRRLLPTIVATTLVAAACSAEHPRQGVDHAMTPHADMTHRAAARGPTAHTASVARRVGAHAVATGLDFPAAFSFAPDGRIFYGERISGRIVILNPKNGHRQRFFRIPAVAGSGEQGLLGVAVAPNFPSSPYVYVYATRNVSGGLRNQIVRIKSSGGKGVSMRVIFGSSTTPGTYHDGGHIAFGPDGMLYAVVGESHSASNAQNLSVSGGKMLRMTPSGGVPPGAGSRVFAYGIRNSFGFDFDPKTGRLWESENGPECNDELNRIPRGRNMGWGPHETCSGSAPRNTNRDGPNPMLPLRWYSPTIAPTGVVFCRKCGLGPTNNGKLFFGAYNTGEIRRVKLTSDRLGVASQSVVLRHGAGILSMEAAPNGHLFFSDSGGIFRLVLA